MTTERIFETIYDILWTLDYDDVHLKNGDIGHLEKHPLGVRWIPNKDVATSSFNTVFQKSPEPLLLIAVKDANKGRSMDIDDSTVKPKILFLLWFAASVRVNIKEARQCKTFIENYVNVHFAGHLLEVICISMEPLTPAIQSILGTFHKIWCFREVDLIRNIKKHILYPVVRKLRTDETLRILNKYKTCRDKLPYILLHDPVVRINQWVSGDVLEFQRRFGSTGPPEIMYRVVAESPQYKFEEYYASLLSSLFIALAIFQLTDF